MRRLFFILMLIFVLGLVACSSSNIGGENSSVSNDTTSENESTGSEGYPEKTIEFVAAGSAGGGLDLMARSVDKALKDAGLQDQPFIIKNQGGGGGNPARSYIAEQEGDPYYLLSESNRVYMNNIVGNTDLGIDDVTPLARMATDYLAWVVRQDSEYTDVQQILDKLKDDPHSVQFGVGTVPSNDQISVLMPIQQSGIDPKEIEIVVSDAGGELMTQLLGGHIEVISTGISEAIEQFKAGEVRILAVTSPEPIEGDLSEVPTFNSMGLDVEILHWRGIFGPPNMPEEAVAYWDEKFTTLTESEEWKEILNQNQWFDAYADSTTFKESLVEERDEMAELLKEIGLAE